MLLQCGDVESCSDGRCTCNEALVLGNDLKPSGGLQEMLGHVAETARNDVIEQLRQHCAHTYTAIL